MLEWMQDPEIASVFEQDFSAMQTHEVLEFINRSQECEDALHFAITDDNDEYLGTVSLKNIDMNNSNAEYAISTRRRAHGTGIALRATSDVLSIAFNVLKLHRVYLNVRADNVRARKFYDKVGFRYEGTSKEALCLNDCFYDLVWLAMLSSQYDPVTLH